MSNIEKQMDAIVRCLTAETEEARELARAELKKMGDSKPAPNMEAIISTILLDIGVPCHIKGHPFLIEAISVVVEEDCRHKGIAKWLYPKVADKFQTTPSRVERAIRHGIELAWERGDLDTLQHYFGNTISISKGKPTNGEFITRVANVVLLRMREAT